MFGEGIPEPEEPADPELAEAHEKAYWDYEPEPEVLLPMLFEEYVDLSVYRALLESSASELGARMTAMRVGRRERRGDDRRPDAGGEPRPPGRDHAGNLGSGRRAPKRSADLEREHG